MQHIIITRFSVRLGTMSTERKGKLFDPSRLKARMDLFKRITLRSMLAQDRKEFRWLLLVDPELPQEYRDELDGISVKHPFIEIITWNTSWNLGKIDWIPGIDPGRPLITSRLDDDDALHRDFTNMVYQVHRRRFSRSSLAIFTFPKGLLWSPSQKRAIHYRSHFIAIGLSMLVDPAKYPVNIYTFDHGRLRKENQSPSDYIQRAIGSRIGRTLTVRDFNAKSILKVMETKGPAFIYTSHGNNDSVQKSYRAQLNSRQALTGRLLEGLLKKFGGVK